jgi:hypothetical protein
MIAMSYESPVFTKNFSHESDLEQAFENGEVVVVCWEPGCTMHRLPHWSETEWITYPRKKGYQRYSHGICAWHYWVCQQDIEQFIDAEGLLSEPPAQGMVASVGG